MAIRWSQMAADNLAAIHANFASSSPTYAKTVARRITNRVTLLASFPELGAMVSEIGDNAIRELIEHPYRIIYRISEPDVEVLAIIHSARQLPPNVATERAD